MEDERTSPDSTNLRSVGPVEEGSSSTSSLNPTPTTPDSEELTSQPSSEGAGGAGTNGPSAPSTFSPIRWKRVKTVEEALALGERRLESQRKKAEGKLAWVQKKQREKLADREVWKKSNEERKAHGLPALPFPVRRTGVPGPKRKDGVGPSQSGLASRFRSFVNRHWTDIEQEILFLMTSATSDHMARVKLIEKILDKVAPDQKEWVPMNLGETTQPINLVINNLNRGVAAPRQIIETEKIEGPDA